MRNQQIKVLIAAFALLFTNAACYNTYFISKSQMEKLEAKVEQKESVAVIVDGCDSDGASSSLKLQVGDTLTSRVATTAEGGTAAADEAAQVEDDIDPATGCPTVKVQTASPMFVLTNEASKYRVTPFNFAVTDTQVVSPDYNLLLALDDVKGAEVQTFSTLKTTLLLTAITASAVSLFIGIQVLAPDERALGE